jgi:membrane associated rhomboid family serine protease
MLYDRDYMRSQGGPDFRSPVVLLLIALVVLFFVECVLQVYGQGASLAKWFALSSKGMAEHQYYRLLTFQFLHEAPWPWHILMNGIGLWFFGRSVLETQGTRRFWILYLLAGTAGGLLDWACQAGHPRYAIAGTIGASGNIMGLAAAFCLMQPGKEIVFFFYVIPVRMQAMTMFWLLFGFSLFGVIFPFGGVSHAAHLGGLLAGVAFAKLMSDDRVLEWFRGFKREQPSRPTEVPVAAGHHASTTTLRPVGPDGDPVSPDEYIRREVDPILDKILAHGPQSLTEKERRILEQAPKRLRKT